MRQKTCYTTALPPHAPVAQLDRALASGAKGRRFESCRARQFHTHQRAARARDARRSLAPFTGHGRAHVAHLACLTAEVARIRIRRMLRARAAVLLLIVSLGVISASCGANVDLTQSLQVVEVSSGWQDVGVVDGQNKLVPSITFRLKNTSEHTLPVLQVNAVFRRQNETEEWGSAYVKVTGSGGLGPGATTEPIKAKSQLGYTGSEPRAVMLSNSQFIDAKVDLFAKYASVQWVRVGERPIDRQLLAE